MTLPIAKILRTVRHLKPVQVVGQVRNRMRPVWERPERFAQHLPEVQACLWPPDCYFLPPGVQQNNADGLRAGRFTFLNVHETLGWPPTDWDVPGLSKLWQYNLHYFEWLWALDYPEVRRAIVDWIDRHPLGRGRVGWEPYPTSLRLMNWCGVCFGVHRAQTEADEEFTRAVRQSIAVHAEWLSKHIETHLLGNHLFENGAALAFAGSAFGGPAAQGWLALGSEIVTRQILEQILSDGMHFERSPMYHVRMTYLMQLLWDTGHAELRALVQAPLARMRRALAQLCHPDGRIALFNDSAFSIYNEPHDLLEAGAVAGSGAWALPDAGYYGYRGGDGSCIVCDAGPIGPDYIPGHAHGDMFSFELSLNSHRVIVDSGVYDYVPSAMRRYCRSTGAHNTVEIDGQDQCEFWGAFRVARRGYPRDVEWQPRSDGFLLRGWHDGYHRLPGAPVHHRTLCWEAARGLSVRDTVTARRAVTAVSRLHLHPGCHIKHMRTSDARVQFPSGEFDVEFWGEGLLGREDSYYCPEFGQKEPNVALTFTFEGKDTETGFTLVSR